MKYSESLGILADRKAFEQVSRCLMRSISLRRSFAKAFTVCFWKMAPARPLKSLLLASLGFANESARLSLSGGGSHGIEMSAARLILTIGSACPARPRQDLDCR